MATGLEHKVGDQWMHVGQMIAEITRLRAIETAARAVVSQDGEMFSEFLDRVVALRDALAASGE